MAGYYIHFEPANDLYFLCGGLYNPTKEVIRSVREQISLEPVEFHKLVKACGDDFHLNWDTALKRIPSDYKTTDSYHDYFRLRSYEIYKPLTQQEVLDENFLPNALSSLKRCYDFNEWLNKCVDYSNETENTITDTTSFSVR